MAAARGTYAWPWVCRSAGDLKTLYAPPPTSQETLRKHMEKTTAREQSQHQLLSGPCVQHFRKQSAATEARRRALHLGLPRAHQLEATLSGRALCLAPSYVSQRSAQFGSTSSNGPQPSMPGRRTLQIQRAPESRNPGSSAKPGSSSSVHDKSVASPFGRCLHTYQVEASSSNSMSQDGPTLPSASVRSRRKPATPDKRRRSPGGLSRLRMAATRPEIWEMTGRGVRHSSLQVAGMNLRLASSGPGLRALAHTINKASRSFIVP